MLAVAKAAAGDDVPDELNQALLYDKWGLPNAGGVDDQPYGLMRKCSVMLNVFNSCHAYYNSSDKTSFVKHNPGAFEIVTAMWKENGEPF
jgi:hypothetical protein